MQKDDEQSAGSAEVRRRLLYGRRQTHKLSARQASLIADLLPRLAIPDGPFLPAALFPGRALTGLALEVGFGGGEHLVYQAARHADWGFIGGEPFLNGMAQALAHIADQGLSNIRLHHGDARDVLERLPTGMLDAVYVLYPDPWPKKRHWKRRFIGPDTVPQLARVLKPGGLLRVASDIPDYIGWTLLHLVRGALFEWMAEAPGDWRTAPADWPGTRYERKALRHGRVPTYLDFRRTAIGGD
jgi:tRNA (guanine-N7-)-methyltransferase